MDMPVFVGNTTVEDLKALLESAWCPGITLADFTSNPDFSAHFKSIHLPLLDNRIPVLPGAAWARTAVVTNAQQPDGASFQIRLRASMDLFPRDGPEKVRLNRNITLYKALLIQEAAHIREGSIEPLNPGRIFDGLQNPRLARDLYCHCVENTRAAFNLKARFPTRADFDRCLSFYHLMTTGIQGCYSGRPLEDFLQALERKLCCAGTLARLISENPGPRLAANGIYDSLETLLKEEALFLDRVLPETLVSGGFATAGHLLDHTVSLIAGIAGRSVVDSVRLAIRCHDLLLPLSMEEPTGEGTGSDDFVPIRPVRDFFRGSIRPASPAELDAMEAEILRRVRTIDTCLRPGMETRLLFSVPEGPAVQGETVQEYDENGRLTAAARIVRKRLDGGDPELISRIRAAYPGVIGSITEQFRNLKLNRLQVIRMQRSPESFNPAGLVYAVIDHNFARQQRFYDASLRNTRSYAIYHLVDASGSTSAVLNPARRSIVEPGRDAKVLDVEKIAAAAIFTAIKDLHIDESFTQKIFLYQSHGETVIYEAPEVSCLTGLEADLANRDGAAIRTVTAMLAREHNDTRVLFIFADGMPSDRDYPNGIHDTSMAVKEAADRGIKVFYILTKNSPSMSRTEREHFNAVSRFATDRKIVYDPSQLPFKTRDLFTTHLF